MSLTSWQPQFRAERYKNNSELHERLAARLKGLLWWVSVQLRLLGCKIYVFCDIGKWFVVGHSLDESGTRILIWNNIQYKDS